ncbi:hypothetical protein B0T41_11135 [Chromobacterium violaceum]|nr:hypothetical protein B0T41_11135 [Chromobacterium violaceum]
MRVSPLLRLQRLLLLQQPAFQLIDALAPLPLQLHGRGLALLLRAAVGGLHLGDGRLQPGLPVLAALAAAQHVAAGGGEQRQQQAGAQAQQYRGNHGRLRSR